MAALWKTLFILVVSMVSTMRSNGEPFFSPYWLCRLNPAARCSVRGQAAFGPPVVQGSIPTAAATQPPLPTSDTDKIELVLVVADVAKLVNKMIENSKDGEWVKKLLADSGINASDLTVGKLFTEDKSDLFHRLRVMISWLVVISDSLLIHIDDEVKEPADHRYPGSPGFHLPPPVSSVEEPPAGGNGEEEYTTKLNTSFPTVAPPLTTSMIDIRKTDKDDHL